MAEPKKKPKEGVKKPVVKKTTTAISHAKKAPKKKLETKANTTESTKTSKAPKKKAILSPIQLDDVDHGYVRVPSTASLRLLEKVELYKIWYKDIFPKYASGVARAGGYAFIFFGVLVASFGHLSDKNLGINAAALVCSLGQCEEVADKDLPAGAPTVKFLNSLPADIANDTDIVIEANNAGNFTLTLASLTSGAVTTVSPGEKISENSSRFLIPARTLPSGTYQTKVNVSQDSGTSYIFEGPVFSIKREETKVEITKAEVETVPVEETEVTELTEETEVTEEIANIIPPVSASSSLASSTDEEVLEEVIVVNSAEINLNQIDLQLYEEELASYIKVSTGDYNPNQVLVYALIPRSENPVLIGEATLAQSSWYFSLSAYDLPKNEYLVYASFTDDGREYQTKGVYYIPATVAIESASKIEDSIILAKKVDIALSMEAYGINSRLSYFTDNNFAADLDKLDVSSGLGAAVKAEVLSNEDSLNQLYFYYAAVVQVENPYLIALAKNQILKKYQSIYTSILESEADLRSQTVLKSNFANIVEKQLDAIFASESDIKSLTNSLTGKDTDKDGLSDYDELTVFLTDPLRADSDLDGVIDSIEILTDSDALVSDTKEMPFHNLDINASIPDKKILSINSIKAEVVKNQLSSVDETNYIISGVAVPNSFVHLVIPSANAVGLIRAGSGGQFSYLLEKPLDNDLPAVVFAGLADSTGRFVASTQTYKLNSKQNDLTASASEIFFRDTYANVSLRDSIVIGAVGLVALGFVLLFLAQMNARSRSTKLIIKKTA